MNSTLTLTSRMEPPQSQRSRWLSLLGLCVLLTACGDTADDTGNDSSNETTGDGGSDTEGAEGILESWSVEEHEEIATVLIVQWTLVDDAEEGWLSYEFEDTLMETPVKAWSAGEGRQPLFGIPAETAVTVTGHFVVDGVAHDIDLGTHETGALPSSLTVPSLVTWDPSAALDSPYVLVSVDVGNRAFFGPCYTVILDRQGRPVWYTRTSDSRLTLFPRVSRLGGHITIDASVYYQGTEGSITRMTLDLEQVEELGIPGFGLTYDELDDGSFIFDHAETGYEYHLERLYTGGERERIWSCYPWMSQYTTEYWGCAVNTVLWNPERNTALWGMFQTSTFAEIDLDSGEKLWHVGQTPDGYDLQPAESMLYLQHYPNWTSEGTILTTTHVVDDPDVQAIREFALDEEAGVLEEVWTYVPEAGHYGAYAGDVTRLDNGNTLIGFGTDGVVQEITPDGEVVWELDYQGKLTGHMTPIADLYALNTGW